VDAALRYQPFMFGRGFVTQIIEPAAAGNPLGHEPSHLGQPGDAPPNGSLNAVFGSVQLLIAALLLFRRTVKPALALLIIWAVSVRWFGESLGGNLKGSTPLAGVLGAVLLYALLAVLLWPTARVPSGRLTSAATASPVGATAAEFAWLVLWRTLLTTCSCLQTAHLTRFRLCSRTRTVSPDGSPPS
jgi:hypothetical protein